jgi:hypothetical protein
MLLGLGIASKIVGAFGGRKCSEDFAEYDADGFGRARGGLPQQKCLNLTKICRLDSGSASERTSQSRQFPVQDHAYLPSLRERCGHLRSDFKRGFRLFDLNFEPAQAPLARALLGGLSTFSRQNDAARTLAGKTLVWRAVSLGTATRTSARTGRRLAAAGIGTPGRMPEMLQPLNLRFSLNLKR